MDRGQQLSARQRKMGLWALYVSTLFSWAGFFMVVPLLAVHYVDGLGWAATTVGVLLAIRQVTQQGVGVVFGVVCDRIGPKIPILAGMLCRCAGFATLAYADSFRPMLFSMLLAGLGGAMFDSPKSAAMAYLAPPEERTRVYSLLGVLGGIGVAAGTQLGALLIKADFRLVCFAGAAVYIVIFLIMLIWLPSMRVSTQSADIAPMTGLRMALRDRTFVLFLVMMSGYWFVWTQFSLTVTLAATDIAGTTSAVSWIYLVNTGVTVALGFLLPRLLGRWLPPMGLLLWGMVILSVGIALVGFATGTPTILFAALIFSVGVVLARPGQETVTANLADPAARGTYFGVAYFSMAIGGGLGNLVGGFAYDYGKTNDAQLVTWLLFGCIGLASTVGLWFYRREFGVVRGETSVVTQIGTTEGISPGSVPATR